ncbi:hypothetical protein F5Y13DRAFT_186667 [Hypoxylon sp. FL1857]|nr:hypothetical protein F5Y13DRAFT_186667 [Hypoxylon sp. FL1857]
MPASRSYTSTFGYSLTRRYPFRWFTPTVTIGGLIATVLISFANLGSSGYFLLVETSTDPNATTSQKGPNMGAIGIVANKMRHRDNSFSFTTAWALRWQPVLHILVLCLFQEDQATYLRTTYDPLGEDYIKDVFYADRFKKDMRHSTDWADLLMRVHYIQLAIAMEDATAKPGSENQTGYKADYRSVYFDNAVAPQPRWHLNQPDGNKTHSNVPENLDQNMYYGQPQNSSMPFVSLSGPIDLLSKSAFSAVMTDLRQWDQPNVITKPDLLEKFTANSRAIIDNTSSDLKSRFFGIFGPAVSYRASDHNGSSLDISPAVFSTNYICQVPHLKPWPELILSVLQADLVFLQVLWWLVNFVTTQWLIRKDKTMHLCECCCVYENGEDENENADSRSKHVPEPRMLRRANTWGDGSVMSRGRHRTFPYNGAAQGFFEIVDDMLHYATIAERRHSN